MKIRRHRNFGFNPLSASVMFGNLKFRLLVNFIVVAKLLISYAKYTFKHCEVKPLYMYIFTYLYHNRQTNFKIKAVFLKNEEKIGRFLFGTKIYL